MYVCFEEKKNFSFSFPLPEFLDEKNLPCTADPFLLIRRFALFLGKRRPPKTKKERKRVNRELKTLTGKKTLADSLNYMHHSANNDIASWRR